jgi:hypothetical protein
MTRLVSTRLALGTAALATGTLASPAAAAATVDDASAALSFWMTWVLVYVAIGAVLMAVAIALAVREERAWSSLLRWTEDDRPTTEDGEPRERRSRRAA